MLIVIAIILFVILLAVGGGPILMALIGLAVWLAIIVGFCGFILFFLFSVLL